MRVQLDGDALRLLRTLRGLSTSGLARAVGVSPPAICHVEMGRRRSVSVEVYTALVSTLGIESRPDWITPLQTEDTPVGTPLGLTLSTTVGMIDTAGGQDARAA